MLFAMLSLQLPRESNPSFFFLEATRMENISSDRSKDISFCLWNARGQCLIDTGTVTL